MLLTRFFSSSPPVTNPQQSFSMGKNQAKTDIDWVISRSASMPGPHDYFEGLPPTRHTPLRALAKEVGVAE